MYLLESTMKRITDMLEKVDTALFNTTIPEDKSTANSR